MSTIRKTISVTSQQNDWIKSQIAKGGFASDSEVIRELIRKEQARISSDELSDEEKAVILADVKKHDETIQRLAR